jgi:hypothetical protein
MRHIAHWLEAHTEVESLDILRTLALQAAEEADCALGLQLAALIRKDDLKAVCDFQIPFDGSITAHQVRYLRQAVAFFSKLEFLELGIDKSQVAIDTFLEAESHCRETNIIWDLVQSGQHAFDPDLCAVFYLATGHIARILGDRPTLDELGLRFGPGATSLTKKRESSIKRKLGSGVSCSKDLVGWARALLCQMPHLAEIHAEQSVVTDEEFWGVVPVVIHTGAISFVRKNYKTDRTTETQPTLNGMLQLGIGDEMHNRASRVRGLDLRNQTLNQQLARIGSLTGEVATLDLKSASNYVAKRPVRALFPEDWYSMLAAARCGVVRLPGGSEISLEMFSGMGNGATFPLQSVLFYALARASATVCGVREPIVAVYGDDIIVDTAVVPLLKRVLAAAGLVVNDGKSYTTGPFRESCGADFLSGINVRPVFVKECLTPAVLFTLHNGLFRAGYCDLADSVLRYIHPDLVQWGPDGYGDGHLVTDDWMLHAKRSNRHRGFGGFTFATFSRSSKKDWAYHPGDAILHTYAVYRRGAEDLLDNRRDESHSTQQDSGLEAIPSLNHHFIDPVTHVTVRRPWGDFTFIRAWATGHGSVEDPSLAIPFAEDPDGKHWGPVLVSSEDGLGWQGRAKACSYPGVDGYRKVMVYTLGG